MRSENRVAVRLGDLVEVVHGFAFKTKYADAEESPYALFTRKNIAPGGGFREEGPRYYHGEFKERFLLEPGDLMLVLTDLSRDGDLLGYPAIVPRTDGMRYLHNQRVGKAVIHSEAIDRRFLYAVLRSPGYRQHVLNTASQTTVRDTAPSRIHDYRFELPPINEQRRIASVLGALDDKIESNGRVGRLLEKSATTLFRARFVDFAGVDNFEQSEIGQIPRTWRAGTLGEMAHIHREPAKGTNDLPYIGLDAMPRASTLLTEWATEGAPTRQASRFEVGDILFGKLRPYFHKVGVAPISGRCSTEILVVRSAVAELYGVVLGHVASQAFIDHCVSVSGGTRMPRAEWKDAAAFKVAIPPVHEAAEFTSMARTIYAQIRMLILESRSLAAIRDVLLPNLISGQTRVPDNLDPAEVIEPAEDALAAAS